MGNLSAYINFNAALDNSTGTPVIRITDVSNYPAGVAAQIAGNITALVQPDGISVGNSNFSSPDIHFVGSALTVAVYPMRLNTIGQFQKGGYLITYVVQCPGYDETTLTKTFNVSYTKPTLVIGNNFDIFTPVLTVSDNTTYSQSGLTLVGVDDEWSALINNVNGTNQNISGTGLVFDLNYLGLYYDANYAVTLQSIATWAVSANPWVTLLAQVQLTQSFDSETPPSISSLRSSLAFLKAQQDAAFCDCNTYPRLHDQWLSADAIYFELKDRGCANDFAGLYLYVIQLQKIFNNGVTPTPAHTNMPIPAYDFGCAAAGSISWNDITGKPSTVIIEWTVGQIGFPGDGATAITDSRLIGYNVLILKNNIQELGFTKVLSSDTINLTTPLITDDVMYVQSIPL